MADLQIDGEKLIARLERAAQQRDESFRSVVADLKAEVAQVVATSAALVGSRTTAELLRESAAVMTSEVEIMHRPQRTWFEMRMEGEMRFIHGTNYDSAPKVPPGRYRALLLLLPIAEAPDAK